MPSRSTPLSPAFALIGAFIRGGYNALRYGHGRMRGFRIAALVFALVMWWLTFSGISWGLELLASATSLTRVVAAQSLEVLLHLALVVLAFSGTLVALMHLFLSKDLLLMATLPVPRWTLFIAKWFEITVVAAWMPTVFGTAVLAGIGAAMGAPWPYYAVGAALLCAIVTIPTSLSVGTTSLLASVLPATRLRDGLVFIILAVLLGSYLGIRALQPERFTSYEAYERLAHTLTTETTQGTAWAPSSWMARALQPYIRGETGDASQLGYGLLVFAAALGSFAMGALMFHFFFARGLSRTISSRGRALSPGGVLAKVISRVAFQLPRPYGALAAKELLTFGRDTSQWSQLFLLASIVVIYLFNLNTLPVHSLRLGSLDPADTRDLLAFINMGLVGFILSTAVLRFLFAAVSLEGRAAWVVLTAPLSTRGLILSKLWVGLPLVTLLGVALVLGGAGVLQASLPLRVLSLIAVIGMSAALCCLGLGMGAMLPDFRATNAARVATSFGGLAFMLISAGFVFISLGALALPTMLIRRWWLDAPLGSSWLVAGGVLSALFALVLTGATALAPLILGAKALDKREVAP